MVHIGDPSFYEAIKARLNRCDAIIFEGVKSFRGRLLTLAYRIPAKRKSLGLVLQSVAIPRKELRPVLIHGDVGSAAFALSWAEIPWHQRIPLLVMAPLYGLALYLFATRDYLSGGHNVDSLPSRNRSAAEDAIPAFFEAIVHSRDEHLLELIEEHLSAGGNMERTTAVLFGGGHGPGIVGVLMRKHGYRVVHSEWITAIATAA